MAFVCLAVLYFIPADIPHKIAFPLAALTAASLWLCPWQISLALAASAAGDLAGSFGNLIVQMIEAGEYENLQAARDAIRASFEIKEVNP